MRKSKRDRRIQKVHNSTIRLHLGKSKHSIFYENDYQTLNIPEVKKKVIKSVNDELGYNVIPATNRKLPWYLRLFQFTEK